MAARRRPLCLLCAALFGALLSLSIAACGSSSDEKTDLMEGEPVTLGNLQYNVVFSRFLNPKDNEDSAYLVGQPAPPEGHSYFGVFPGVWRPCRDVL